MVKQGLIGRSYQEVRMTGQPLYYKLEERDPLMIDFERAEHIFIAAKSGSGKTYGAAVLIEEMLKLLQNYGAIAFDVLGNLFFDQPNGELEVRAWNSQLRRNEVTPREFNNVIRWVPAGDKDEFDDDEYDKVFAMRAKDLTHDILCNTFDFDVVDAQSNLYRKARRNMMRRNLDYSLNELIQHIREDGKTEYHFQDQTIEALITKLDALQEMGIIQQTGVGIEKLSVEGKLSIIDLSCSSMYTARLLVSFISEALLSARRRIKKKVDKFKKLGRMGEVADYIPPTMLIVDEAHNFLKRNAILTRYIKEARNVECMLTAISQSPDLSKDVFSNITHIFVGQMNFDDDIASMKAIIPIEKTPKDFRTVIKGLGVGCFYYYNSHTLNEKRIRFRVRHSLHSANTELEDERKWIIKTPVDEDDYEDYDPELEYHGSEMI